jgi:HEAT repeat protein
MRILFLPILALQLAAQSPAGLAELLSRAADYEYGQSRQPLAEVDVWLRTAPTDRAGIAGIEQQFLRLLEGKSTLAAKDFACRRLGIYGSDASVPVLARLLRDAATFEMARDALHRIPGEKSAAALRAELPRTSGKNRLAIINSLSARRDQPSTASLTKLLDDQDAATASAAAAALGRIATPAAAQALAQAAARSSGGLHLDIQEASLECAARLPEAAPAIYKRLIGAREPEMIRVAALIGLASSGKSAALPLLRDSLRKETPLVRAAAVKCLVDNSSPEAAAILAAEWPSLPEALQVQSLPGTRSTAPTALRSPHESVRVAALEVLSNSGAAAAVPLLANAAANPGSDAELAAARLALDRISGPGTDAAVVSGLRSAQGRLRLEYIRAAGTRVIQDANDSLLAALDDPEARRESLRALRETAGEQQVLRLIEALSSMKSSAERREAERALTAAVRRAPANSTAIRDAYRQSVDPAVRASLLQVMALAGQESSIPLFREILTSQDADLRRPAILALSEWPGEAPLPLLLESAGGDPIPALRVLAVRGYLRLAALPSTRSASETARLLASAVKLASQPEEKKIILAALPRAVCPESLAIAEAMAADPAVAAEAQLAAGRLRSALKPRNQ